MKLKHCYLLLTIGLFISTFFALFVLGYEYIYAIVIAILNTMIFLIILYYMIKSGRWKY